MAKTGQQHRKDIAKAWQKHGKARATLYFAMSVSCVCHEVAMLCLVTVMSLQMRLPCLCHAFAMLLPCINHVFAMYVP